MSHFLADTYKIIHILVRKDPWSRVSTLFPFSQGNEQAANWAKLSPNGESKERRTAVQFEQVHDFQPGNTIEWKPLQTDVLVFRSQNHQLLRISSKFHLG